MNIMNFTAKSLKIAINVKKIYITLMSWLNKAKCRNFIKLVNVYIEYYLIFIGMKYILH